jgi:tetratricopeptide (TPR) repeat protein
MEKRMMQIRRCKYFIVISLFMVTVLWGADPGLNAFHEGKYDTSLAYYLKRLEENPDDKVLHYNAGTSALKAGRTDLAATHFDRTIRHTEDPEFLAKTWYNRGHLSTQNGQLEDALKAFEQAILLNPGDINSKVMYELVKAQLQQQQQEQDQQSDGQNQEKKENKEQQQKQQSSEEDKQKDSQQEQEKEDQSRQDESSEKQSEPEESQTRQQEATAEEKEEELTRQQMVNLLDAMREKEKEAMKEILRYRYRKSTIEREKDW